jgi:hypothetical protein
MKHAIAFNAAEFSAYLAAIEAHPFASLLLAIIVIAFIRARVRSAARAGVATDPEDVSPRRSSGRTPLRRR